ncbi:MAG: fibronectin type III domain-containing protein [Flavobacterium sp.]|nr:fibronectin type III domain-containing protein [Flavobacterium sp.]
MKTKLLLLMILMSSGVIFAQSFWKTTSKKNESITFENKRSISNPNVFELNFLALKNHIANSPNRFDYKKNSTVAIDIPNELGQLEHFIIYESSNMDPALADRYPEIKSYVGQGVENPATTVYFSISPLGFQSMKINSDRTTVFIEPYTTDLQSYVVYKKSDKKQAFSKFECSVVENGKLDFTTNDNFARPNADDGFLRTFRCALSVTGEYTAYFGGTKALALAAMNNSMTRVNGVFEMDFGVHMNLIANTDDVIYLNAATDPYSNAATGAGGAWNGELQSTLTSVIGEANYDVGHLFGASGGGGNAGCIGCVCVNGQKGSGFTSPNDGIPMGDNFDIDYVAHEFGHQFGANHTWTHGGNEGTGVQMEPGSGSTVMGYAGITSLDVQPHSDAYFHAISIQQVTNNIKTKTCQVNTATGNAIPTADAGLDYTVPKSTPFMLTGAGTDTNNSVLTYCWEQMNSQTNSTAPNATKTSGVNFRSYNPSTSPVRVFPRMQSVLAGATTTAGTEITVEALPSVARTLNFRLTTRDNNVTGPANNSDDMIVTVNATAGPFTVTVPNTAVSYAGNSSQTITWAVAGTTANGVNCANVDILMSTDGGTTFPITLLSATPNDGTQALTIPNLAGTTNRIMIKGTNHIFFDVSNTNFTITSGTPETTPPTAPTLTASGTTQTSTVLSWSGATDNVAVTGYNIYQGAVLIGTTVSSPYTVTGLTPGTTYTFTVRAKDADGNLSVPSNAVNVTTEAPDTTPPSPPTLSASGTTSTSTVLSWSGATDNLGVTGYDVFQGAVNIGSTTTATTFTVTGLTPSTTYSFTVKAKDAAGNISSNSNVVNVTTDAPDTIAPSAPVLSFTAKTANTVSLSWTTSTDNVGVTGYDVYQGATLIGSTTSTTTFVATGLTASTAYSFTVRAKDAAGNISVPSNVLTVTTDAFNYCASQGNSVADELIGNVQLGTINNASTGGTGYTDFTGISTNLTLGSTNTITITPTWTSTVYPEGYGVFIDYNKDGDFVDAGETVWTLAATTTTPVSGTFTVPATATLGQTRMRVSLKYNGIPTPCETFSYGQVEDYTVVIVPSSSTLNLKLYLEGYYDTTTHSMRSVQFNQGTSSNPNDVDTINVELRDASTPTTLIATAPAILQTNGTAVCNYPTAPSGSFYVVVNHRNSVQTWSATPITIGPTAATYDFSDAATKAFGNNLVQLESGAWGCYTGDMNQDGNVDNSDYSNWEVDANEFAFGNFATDLNGDGNVDNSDFSIWENNSNNFIFVITP